MCSCFRYLYLAGVSGEGSHVQECGEGDVSAVLLQSSPMLNKPLEVERENEG